MRSRRRAGRAIRHSLERMPLEGDAGPSTLALALAARFDVLERTLGRPAANRRLPLEARLD